MKQNVIISIQGTQLCELDEPQQVEFITEGTLCQKQGHYYLVYQESEMTGLSGLTTLKVEPKRITLSRNGAGGTHLIFEQGQKFVGHYDTGVGVFNVGVVTQSLRQNIDTHGGELTVSYTLEINNELTCRNTFYINVREAGKPHVQPHSVSKRSTVHPS